MRILVVDDSSVMRSMVRGAIEAHARGAERPEIVEARDGVEARKALSRHAVDMLLIDWNMPRLDGLSLVRELRKRGETMPIIMITSVRDHDQQMEAVRAGVSDYITKPFQMADLWERIQELR